MVSLGSPVTSPTWTSPLTESSCMEQNWMPTTPWVPNSKVHGANMGPSGADRTQVGPMLTPWTLLSGVTCSDIICYIFKIYAKKVFTPTYAQSHRWRRLTAFNNLCGNDVVYQTTFQSCHGCLLSNSYHYRTLSMNNSPFLNMGVCHHSRRWCVISAIWPTTLGVHVSRNVKYQIKAVHLVLSRVVASNLTDQFVCATDCLSSQRKKNSQPITGIVACMNNYNDVIMSTMASQINSLTIVYSTIYSGTDQRKYQSTVSLVFVREFTNYRWIPRTNDQ